MQKSFVFFLVLTMLLGIFGLNEVRAAPEDEFADPFMPIKIKLPDGAVVDTLLTGYVGRHEALVPLSVVTDYLKSDFLIEASGAGLYVRIPSPAFSLETSRLNEVMREGVDFRLNAVNVNGAPLVNLKGLEKLLGISLEKAAGAPALIVRLLPAQPAGTRLHAMRLPVKQQGKISLVWDHVLGEPADLAREEKIPGLTVISPTWFAVTDSSGTVASKADWKYVQDAHDKGYKVWPLISNSFEPDMTKAFLADEAAQDRTVRQLLMFTALYDLDGINIDFENVYDDDRDRLTGFVARLTDRLKEQGVVVSFDATVPSGVPMWSNCYDRAALGRIVDYFMVMTYDEHWRTSPVAGSVASIGWVERGILSTLQSVPKEKLLMGVPFYTREWREPGGYGRVRSATLWMADVDSRVAQYGLIPQWLDSAGQHYIEYADDSFRYKVWIEDEKSIGLKVGLSAKYDLAGVAAWRKGFEKPGVWEVIRLGLQQAPSREKPDAAELKLANWSLKSYMEKLRGASVKGVSE